MASHWIEFDGANGTVRIRADKVGIIDHIHNDQHFEMRVHVEGSVTHLVDREIERFNVQFARYRAGPPCPVPASELLAALEGQRDWFASLDCFGLAQMPERSDRLAALDAILARAKEDDGNG